MTLEKVRNGVKLLLTAFIGIPAMQSNPSLQGLDTSILDSSERNFPFVHTWHCTTGWGALSALEEVFALREAPGSCSREAGFDFCAPG